ncbi:MAG: DUF5684 domain-containing protein [Bacteroidota bacterium]|nr:DUF5684 domain-containing protein [Bacteroidota bacterium]
MNNYTSDSPFGPEAILAVFMAMLIPILVMVVITVIGKWKIYEKAGKPGWAALIPIYTWIVMLEIVGKPIWWIFLFFVPCVNIVFMIWTVNLLSKSFGQSEGFTIGLILLGFVFYPILGFGTYRYIGPSAAEARYRDPNNPFTSTEYRDPFNNPNTNNPNPPQA